MSSFGEYVAGKTIAVVGPAPAPYDQTAEINAHDLVYRTSYGFNGCLENEDLAPFDPQRFPTGTGTRCDITFYNGQMSRLTGTGIFDACYQQVEWAVHKFDPAYRTPLCNVRTANRPPYQINRIPFQPSQVPWMLYDLTHFEVESVTVFGSNFYAGPIEDWYDPNYDGPDWIARPSVAHDPTEAMGPGFHDQEGNRELVRLIRRTVGWPVGDKRFLEALDVPREVHEAAIAEQSARFRKTASTV